jgi:hypothetical protein
LKNLFLPHKRYFARALEKRLFNRLFSACLGAKRQCPAIRLENSIELLPSAIGVRFKTIRFAGKRLSSQKNLIYRSFLRFKPF